MLKKEMENELMTKLKSRSDREIIDSLKALPFEGLINTEEGLNDYLDTITELDENSKEEQHSIIKQAEKSVGYLHIAIKERMNEMILAEKKLKEMLCNN